MSPWKGRVYGSRWRGMRLTSKFSSPFCQHSMITISIPEHFPEDWISAVWLIWVPLRLGGQGSHLVSVGACLCLWRPKTALAPPPFELGSERGCTSHFHSDCSACVPEGSWESVFVSSQCWERQWYRHGVYVSLWSSKWETGTFILKGQKHF